MRRSVIGCLAAAAATLATSLATADEAPIELKLAHPYAANHYHAEQGLKVWARAVEELSDGAVAFTIYPAAQLGKSQVALLESGLADLAFITPSSEPDKLPSTRYSSCRRSTPAPARRSASSGRWRNPAGCSTRASCGRSGCGRSTSRPCHPIRS